jgi:hypothetical protein
MKRIEANLIGSLGLNPNTVRRGESSRLAFLLPVTSVYENRQNGYMAVSIL